MKNIVVVFTCNNSINTFGGIKTILDSYAQQESVFESFGYKLFFFNYKPNLVGKYGAVGHVFYGIRQVMALRKYLKKMDCNAVHIHTSRDFLFLKDILLGKMVKKSRRLPVLMTVHVGSAETVFSKTKRFRDSLIRLHNKYINKTFFLSKSIQKEFVKLGFDEDKTLVLYNFHNLAPASKDKFITDDKILRLIYVGAVHRDKGVLDLLYGLKTINNIPYHLDICGSLKDETIKDEFEALLNEMRDTVTMNGIVNGSAKTDLYMQSDILVLPSYHEGLPMVILEALKTGCAIISTRVGATPEILSDENAYWIDVKAPDQIRNAIEYFHSQKQCLDKMKRNNEKLAERFSINNHIDELCKVYNTVIIK